MHDTTTSSARSIAIALLTLGAAAAGAPAQQRRQPDFHWQKSLAAASRVRIYNINGNITVVPSSTGTVEVLGTKISRWSGDDDEHDVRAEVHETSDGIVVCVMWEGIDGSCDEDGYEIHDNHSRGRRRAMNLEVRVPAGLRVRASDVSGEVTVNGVQGDLDARSVSGGLRVEGVSASSLSVHSVSGDVRLSAVRATSLEARSVSGDIEARIAELTGTGDISAHTVSGDIRLELPRNLDADLSLRTVSGELTSDYQMALHGRLSRRRMEARIGKGGRDLDLVTVSGDVELRAAR